MSETTTPDRDVTPITKEAQTGRAKKAAGTAKAPAKRAAGAAKAPAKKAAGTTKKASTKKAAGTGIVRAQSTISKEGTKKDEHTGETLPVTAFPTVRQSDGSYVRGPVARKNLEAWRAAKKADREKTKAAKAAAKKATGTAKKAS
jgi:hypothetical protein